MRVRFPRRGRTPTTREVVLENRRLLASGFPLIPEITTENERLVLHAAALVPSRLWPELERGPFFQLVAVLATNPGEMLRFNYRKVPAPLEAIEKTLAKVNPGDLPSVEQRLRLFSDRRRVNWDDKRSLWVITGGHSDITSGGLSRLLMNCLLMAVKGPIDCREFYRPNLVLPSNTKLAVELLRKRKFAQAIAIELDDKGRLVKIHSADPLDYITIGPWDPMTADLCASMRPYKEVVKPGSEYEFREPLPFVQRPKRLSAVPVSRPPPGHRKLLSRSASE